MNLTWTSNFLKGGNIVLLFPWSTKKWDTNSQIMSIFVCLQFLSFSVTSLSSLPFPCSLLLSPSFQCFLSLLPAVPALLWRPPVHLPPPDPVTCLETFSARVTILNYAGSAFSVLRCLLISTESLSFALFCVCILSLLSIGSKSIRSLINSRDHMKGSSALELIDLQTAFSEIQAPLMQIRCLHNAVSLEGDKAVMGLRRLFVV